MSHERETRNTLNPALAEYLRPTPVPRTDDGGAHGKRTRASDETRDAGSKRNTSHSTGAARVNLSMKVQLIATLLITISITGCKRQPSAGGVVASADAGAAKTVTSLPGAFSGLKIGMTQSELEVAFPPVEDISKCEAMLVGGDAPLPPAVPGAEKKAHAQCARSVDIGGLTFGELTAITKAYAEISKGDPVDVQQGLLATYAQVRGGIRAGAVSEAALLEADHGRNATAYAATSDVVDRLLKGGLTFARANSSRRELCALISDSCDDVDTNRVRTYTQGSYSLGQIDADAHSRVVYGKCRTPFLQNERTLATRLVKKVGALGGIGLARAARPDHQLDPNSPSSFGTYASRSNLEASVAKFGVLVANALPAAEDYWKGAVSLVPPAGPKDGWGSGVAWLRDGQVVRVLLNVGDDTKLGDLPAALAGAYAAPGITNGAVTTWSLPGGVWTRLDIGAATSLVVGRSATGSTPPAASAGSAASAR